ncbi:phycoerythrin alpha subunit 3 [Guillardia theta CCMP2712]|uniref:Phycoerythrin alpha subunit 3 n=2 Tax=Guillardia theta TaxID=55529 RepID=L1JDL0_GUITC|nr:phycoerythrin alpha subunit 3 [Guillardia theta CCMP2712]EKX46372.1 phycoerythrin alpha subunit 3 [Guillardia theta CCMP2712]|eukprot:XP_005833352.1 phycoerythrin alpha subunit 3 [Guillardia theta CCMP2712]
MASKVLAFSALVASASAFAPGASVQPRLRSGATSVSMTMDKSNRAPVVTVFDHRGCQRGKRNTEYQGLPANSQDDEMLVKVAMQKVAINEAAATDLVQQLLGTLKK